MNEFIIDGGSIAPEKFSGASIYLDACFILSFFDQEDHRHSVVADMLDLWSEQDVALGFSTHTYAEVVQNIFKMIVLGSLQAYHDNNRLINQTKYGFDRISERDKNKIGSLDTARFLYRIGKDLIPHFGNRKEIHANVTELIKMAKEKTQSDIY